MELYKKHRPADFSDVVGQDEAVSTLQRMLDNNVLPHTLLFTGPSGCGKTTLARILKEKLGCSDLDFYEMNSADFRGIDTIRSIGQRVNSSAVGGKCRIWLVDEMHQLTSQAQEAFLKLLEDTPRHVYFFLCTTERQKVKNAIITRSTEIKLKKLQDEQVKAILRDIAKKEKIKTYKSVVSEILEVAQGSARKAVVLLHQLIGCDDEDEQREAIRKEEESVKGLDICRALMKPNGISWKELADALKSYESDNSNIDPEALRYQVLGYAKSCMRNGGPVATRAYSVISAFRDNFYDSKMAGVYAACYEVLQDSKQ